MSEPAVVVSSDEPLRIELPELMRVRAVLVSGEGILADDDLEVRLRGRTYALTRTRAPEGVTGFVASAVDGADALEPERVAGPSEPETRTPLVYGDGPYDVDNDGFVGPSDAVDFAVPEADSCVIWTVVTESASIFCQGDEACCGGLGFPNVESETPGELVLTRETADGVAGNVLARTPDASFSEPLEFSFAATPERYERLDASCGDACDLDVVTDSIELSIGSGRFTIDRVEVVYEPIGQALARESRSTYEVSGGSARVQEDLSDRLSRGERVRMIVRNESGFFVEDLRKDGFDALVRDGRVAEATVDQPVSVFTTDALTITNIASVQSTYGLSGSGVAVCVVDTGVDVGLLRAERVEYEGWNVLTGTDDVQDGHGHGTRVAYPLIRAAPDASFVFVKALDDSGDGYESDVLHALDVCAERGAQVISLSIGSGLYDGLCDANIVAARVNELVANGTIVVAAAGNEGGPLLKAPACASNATAVIASDDADMLWSGSSYIEGHAVLSAPGVTIETVDEFGNAVSASGTSMVAPFVSGAAALLLENTSYDPLDLRELLVSSGEVFEESGFSYARLNVENALSGVVTNDLLSGASEGNGTNGSFGVLADPVVSGVTVTLVGDAYEVTYSASDADGDPLYNTTDWRVNGTSIAVLNAPFNVNVSTTTSGAVTDLTTYENNGTLSSGGAQPTWNGSCIVGGCYYFDGANDVLSFGDPADGSLDIGDSSWTYGLWVYPVTNVGLYDIPLYKGGTSAGTAGYDFELGSGGWGAGVSDGTNIVTAVESSAGFTGAWYHVMAVLNRDTDRLVLYINGTEVANSSAAAIGTVTTATDLQMGEQSNGNDDFDGYIDEVLIFRKALSPSQVKAIYDAQLAGQSVDVMNESVFGPADNVSARVYSSDEAVYSFADPPVSSTVSSCQTISSSGIYTLTGNLTSTGSCMHITASDVDLTCDGYTINYADTNPGIGVLIDGGLSNVKVRDCVFVQTGIPGVMHDNNAIYVNGTETNRSNLIHVEDVWINKQGDDRGIYFLFNDNSSITRTTVNSSSTSNNAEYITITASDPVEIFNLTVANVNVTGPQGEFIETSYVSTSLFSNIMINATNSQWRDFRVFNGRDNVIENTHIIRGGGHATESALNVRSTRTVIRNSSITYSGSSTAVQFVASGDRARDSIMYDTELIYLGGGGTPRSVYMEGGTFDVENVYLVNVTLNKSQIAWEADQQNKVIYFGWRLGAYVNDTEGNPVSGVDVSWASVGPEASENLEPTGSGFTGSDGWFRGGELYEYKTNATTAVYFQNHSVSVSKTGYEPVAAQYANMSTNQEVFFTLEALPPEVYGFSTCTQTGRSGPSQGQCDTAYASTNLEGNVTVTSGIQSWTVPKSGYWNVTAYGAQGGYGGRTGEGGYGAMISGVFLLTEGEVLNVLVGQAGGNNSYRPSGGGASAVWENDTVDLLVVAGAGGAYGVGTTTTYQSLAHGQTTTSGQDGFGGTASSLGGTNGNGGAGTGNRASGGGGWLTDGGDGTVAGSGGQALIDGGLGGTGAVVNGGFGGGGATDESTTWGAASGGGGYSGGGGGYSDSDAGEGAGGGGGSFNAGDNQTNIAASNTGRGSVVITYMAPPPTARLSVWDGTDAQGGSNIYDVGEQARFFANYSNWSSSAPISGAGNVCSIAFDIGSGYGSATSMTYNSSSTFYEYSRNFTDPGTFSYNVSCTSSSYLDLDAIDTIAYGNFQILDAVLTPTGDIFAVDYTVTGALSPVNTTDWRGDGVSFAVLNMPFNVNVSNTTSGAVTDLSSYSNNGTRGNGVEADSPTWNASCRVGGCYDFNGSQQIRIPGATEFNITTDIAVEAWIYPTAAGQEWSSNVIAKPRPENNGHQLYAIRFGTDRVPSFRFSYDTTGVSTVSATAAIPLNEWTHIVGTYDGTTQRIYINGAQNNTLSRTTTIATGATDVSIGVDYLWNPGRYFVGLIDEPKIYTRVLSADQILANYNAGAAGEAINTWEGADATTGENLSVRVYSSNEEEYVFADSNSYEIISACGTISSPGVYALSGNLSATATCLTITSSDVDLSCGGNTITYSTSSTGFGITLADSIDNTTIRDCTITQGSASASSRGIDAQSSSWVNRITNLTISNVDVTTSGSSSQAFQGYYVDGVVIEDSEFTSASGEAIDFFQLGELTISRVNATATTNHGLDLAGDVATQVLLEDSTFITNANSYGGINIAQSNVTMNRVNATNTQDSTASVNPGVYLRSSSFENIIANGSYFEGGSYALLRVGGDLQDVTISNSTIQTESNIFRTTDAGPINWYFVNVTSNSGTISWGGSGTRLAHWGHYVSVYVNDTRGNPIEANVSYVDGGSFANNPTPSGTVTTSSNGTNTFVLYEWDEVPGPTRTDHNDYAISVSKAGWSDTISSDPQTVNTDLNLVYTLTHPFDIDSCQTISSPGSYEVISDISASATCMFISSSDVELDCNGYTLNYGQSAIGYGVLLDNSIDNVTVRNCIANQDASPGSTFSHAFFVDGNSGAETTNVTFENNTGYTKAGNSVGFYAEYAPGIVISNHTSETNGASSNGISVFDTTGATIIGSSSTTNSTGNAIRLLRADDTLVSASTADALGGGYGLYAGTLSNLTVSGSTIIASGSSARAFQTDTVTGATIIGSVINATATSTRGLLVNSASTDIEVYNSTINSDLSQDVYLVSYSSANSVRFINVTYDESSFFFESNAGTLSVGYYLDLYVENAGSSPVSATVNYTDNGAYSSLNPTASDTGISVGGDGYFRDLVLYERTQNATAVYYHTNYSFDVYNPSYSALIDASRNFTTNEQLTFTLSEDTCTPPGSGDWTAELSDNCEVSSLVDIHPNKLVLTGSGGTFTIASSGILRIGDLHYEPSIFDGSSTFIIETGGELRVEP